MSIEQIDPPALQAMLDANSVLLIDVRERGEYDAASIDGAILIPMSACHPPSLPCNPDKKIVFMCKAGGRSQRVGEAYAAAFPDAAVYNLAGGIDGWMARHFPVRSDRS